MLHCLKTKRKERYLQFCSDSVTLAILVGFLRQWETFIGHPFSAGNKAHKDGFCSELIGCPGRGCDIFGGYVLARGKPDACGALGSLI